MLGSRVHAHRGVGECSRCVAGPNFTVSGALLPVVRLQKAPAVPREGLCCRPCPLVLQGARREKHIFSHGRIWSPEQLSVALLRLRLVTT